MPIPAVKDMPPKTLRRLERFAPVAVLDGGTVQLDQILVCRVPRGRR